MTDKIMRLVALADGSPHPLAGRYVVDYDPTILPGGVVKLDTTDDPRLAKRLDAGTALAWWKAVSPNMPTRPDGKPNRPLTAFSVVIEDAP